MLNNILNIHNLPASILKINKIIFYKEEKTKLVKAD